MSASSAIAADPAATEHMEMMATGAESGAAVSSAEAERREREADQRWGAVDPSLKMQLRKLTAHLVRWVGSMRSAVLLTQSTAT